MKTLERVRRYIGEREKKRPKVLEREDKEYRRKGYTLTKLRIPSANAE